MARMELTDQKHSSDSIANEQEVIRCTEKTARLFGLDEQNTRAYKALSGQIWALEKRLEDYHFEYVKLKRKVNLLEAELNDLDECVDRETVVDLIKELALSPNNKKMPKKGEVNIATVDFYEFSSSEESESDVVNIKKIIHKQRRKRLAVQNDDQPSRSDQC